MRTLFVIAMLTWLFSSSPFVSVPDALTCYPHDFGHVQSAIRLESANAFKDKTADAVPWPSTHANRELAARHCEAGGKWVDALLDSRQV